MSVVLRSVLFFVCVRLRWSCPLCLSTNACWSPPLPLPLPLAIPPPLPSPPSVILLHVLPVPAAAATTTYYVPVCIFIRPPVHPLSVVVVVGRLVLDVGVDAVHDVVMIHICPSVVLPSPPPFCQPSLSTHRSHRRRSSSGSRPVSCATSVRGVSTLPSLRGLQVFARAS
ncbi:hypothetical protein OH77DRAFT_846779 [Trametes cingulata]|nr:hypothetical protein OH77DRAFT_846779 [Trametes cingulata]